MSDRPLSRSERRTIERIGFLQRLGIYEGEPPMPGEDENPNPLVGYGEQET